MRCPAMAYCGKCGGYTDGEGARHCYTCSAAHDASGPEIGTQCQRCGMYLPSHELQMWNSRLFCPYCIMDLQDEERRVSGEGRHLDGGHGVALEVPCQNCWMRFSQGELRMRNGRLYCMHCLSCMEDESKYSLGLACGRCGEHFTAHEVGGKKSAPHCPSCLMVMEEQAKQRKESRFRRTDSLKCSSCGAFLPRHKLETISSKLYCPHCVDLHIEKYSACQGCGKGLDTAYVAFGKHMCIDCYLSEAARQEAQGKKQPSFVEGLISGIRLALG